MTLRCPRRQSKLRQHGCHLELGSNARDLFAEPFGRRGCLGQRHVGQKDVNSSPPYPNAYATIASADSATDAAKNGVENHMVASRT